MAKKITLSFGFITIRTKFEVAVDEETSGTHTVCQGSGEERHEPARVKQSVGCPVCKTTHSSVWGFRDRAIEVDTETGPQLVVVDQEELQAALGVPRTGRVGIQGRSATMVEGPAELAFHPREKVMAATVAGDSVQNIYPDKGGEAAYTLLRDALLERPDIVGVMVWAPSTKNALWTVEVGPGGILVASKRCWPEQMRATLPVPSTEVPEAQRAMFGSLVDSAVEDFDMLRYVDEAKKGLDDLLAERAGTAVAMAAPSGSAGISSLLEQLEATRAARAARDAAAKPAKKAPAKKAPAKKAAAKKTAAPRKAAAKKVTTIKTNAA